MNAKRILWTGLCAALVTSCGGGGGGGKTNSPPPTNTKPVITLNGSNPSDLYLNDAFGDPGATVSDAQDGSSTIMGTGNVNTAVSGSYTLTYNHTDTGGLSADTVTRAVNVASSTAGDRDNDGWNNSSEVDCGTDPDDVSSVPTDTDGDGTCNFLDPDDDGDGADDTLEIACGTDPLEPDDTASDVNGNGECDNLETNKLTRIGVTPRFVRSNNVASTPFKFHAQAVGIDLANGLLSPAAKYWPSWMTGGAFSESIISLNDDMLDGDAVAGDYKYSFTGTMADLPIPASMVYADGAFHMQPVFFELQDSNGDFVQSDFPLSTEFELMLLDPSIPEEAPEVIAPGVKATSNTAFFEYDGGVEAVGFSKLTEDYFTHFEDVHILILMTYGTTSGNGVPSSGNISNDVGGLCMSIHDSSETWGSDGALQQLIFQEDSMGWTIPHEVGHRWGFYCNNPEGISIPKGSGFHISPSSLQGQMAAAGYLDELPSGDFEWKSDDGDGGFQHRAFSPWMKYLACEIPKENVTPMWIINPAVADQYPFGSIIPRSDMTEITINDFIAENGTRSKVGNECQTVFSVGYAVASDTSTPLTPTDYTGYSVQSAYFVGNSPGQGEIEGGFFTQSDMISINAAMGGNKLSFVSGVIKKNP